MSELSNVVKKINDVSDKLTEIASEIDSHKNDTMSHYEPEKYNDINNRVSNIESTVGNIDSSTLIALADLSKSDINKLIKLSKSIDSINNMVKYQYILFDYILNKTSAPQNIKDIIELIKSNNGDDTSEDTNSDTVDSVSNSNVTNEVISTINAYDIIQNSKYRFVTTDQIESWDKTKRDLEALKCRINFTENTSIINLKDIPVADENNDGIITSQMYKDIIDIEVPQPDWNVKDEKDINYIKNKPTTLPAKGGNADTVGGYTINKIFTRNKLRYTVGYRSDGIYDYFLEDDSIIDILKDIHSRVLSQSSPNIVEFPSMVVDIVSDEDLVLEDLDLRGNNTIVKIRAKSVSFSRCNISGITFNGISGNSIIILDNNTILNSTFEDINFIISGSNNMITHNKFNSSNGITISGSKKILCKFNTISYNTMTNGSLLIDGSTMNITKNNIQFNTFDNDIIIKGRLVKYNTFISNLYKDDCTIKVQGGVDNFFMEPSLDNIVFSSNTLATNNETGSTSKKVG